MTFYGEALGLDSAGNVSGTPLGSTFGSALRYFYRDADSVTATAGESFIAGMFPNAQNYASGDVAVLSWVVEFAAGSSGTVRLSSGLDPTFVYEDPAPLTEDLGEHVVAGQSRLVVETTSITGADILAEVDAPALFVEVLSGTVHVLQIRLRVWPVGGPQGAWAPGAAFDTTAGHAQRSISVISDQSWAGSLSAALAGARASFESFDGTSVVWSSTAQAAELQVGGSVELTSADVPWQSELGTGFLYLEYAPNPVEVSPSGLAGVHPDRVPDDYGTSVQAVGGGPLLPELTAWSGGLIPDEAPIEDGDLNDIGSLAYYIGVEAGVIPMTIASGSTFNGPLVIPAEYEAVSTGVLWTPPPIPAMVVTFKTGLWFTDPPAAQREYGGVALSSLQAQVHVPDHEWWDPSLPWVEERQPRFFVKDHEEVWRPVGFGKPASDLSLFHVWTPVGWYVECRDGETYTNAHPLKVKLYDGSWDTVAHMRPV